MTASASIVERLHRSARFIEQWANTSSPERHRAVEQEAIDLLPQIIEGCDFIDRQSRIIAEKDAEIERLRKQVFELEHGVEDQVEEAAYHARQRAAAESSRDAAVEAERAACAKVASSFDVSRSEYNSIGEEIPSQSGRVIAFAIRSRALLIERGDT